MNESTDKRVVLVTGGTGVGRAAVLQFSRRGFNVVINYSRSVDDAQTTAHDAEQLGAEALVVACDVAKDEQVAAMVEQCRQRFGRLDVIVNNAGRTHFIDHADLSAVTEDVWDEILGVNLKVAFFVSRAGVPLLQSSGGGAIVNVASTAGVSGQGSSIPYAASKGAMITMTKSLARSLAPGIRVNAVCPGVIVSRWLADRPEMLDGAIKETPLERASTTDDVADAITFLACDAEMITGQALIVDGGRTV
jgi:3-oxoacyl-[acyl-carrier protein] reductase